MFQWTHGQVEKAFADFRKFLFIVWRMVGLPEPTPIQYDMGKTLQNPPSDRFILQGFRGVAKSFITCALIVWLLWKDPQKKCMIVSASKDRADANAVFIKRIIQTIPFLSELLPKDNQRNTQNLFDVGPAVPDISPSVKSVGITGQITGSRADILVADDVEVPNNSGTQQQRDKLGEAVKEFDAILKPGGQIIYLGTPQNEMSIYNELQKRGYSTIIYPVVYPESQKEREFYGDRLAPVLARKYDKNPQKYAGVPTDPLRFNEEEIAKRRLSYGRAGFALQFLLNTNLSDAEKYPLKVQDLIVTQLDLSETSLKWSWASGPLQRLQDVPCVGLKGDFFYGPFQRSTEVGYYTGTVMAIDPSGRGKDETAYAIVKYLNGHLFVMEIGGYKDGYSDATLRTLANKAKFYKVTDVTIEPNFGDGMFTKLITPIFNEIHPCSIQEAKRSSTQKEARIIDTLEPVMAQHKLIFQQQVLEEDYKVYEIDPAYSLIYQMTRICRDRNALAHDDRLDALTLAVAFWLEFMDRNAQVGMDEHMDDLLEQWMDPERGIMYVEEKPEGNLKVAKYNHSEKCMNILQGFFED
jgi:hypothetical protein